MILTEVNGGYQITYKSISLLSLYLLVIFSYTGLTPFALDAEDLELSETGYSNIARQVVFLIIFLMSFLSFKKIGRVTDVLKCKNLIFVLFFCVASIFWAEVPDIAARRVSLLIVTSFSVIFICSSLSLSDIVEALVKSHAVILIVSFVGVLLLPGAVHSQGELFDSNLVGNWKGVFPHKNLAAPAMAYSIFLFLSKFVEDKKSSWIYMSIFALVFIYFSQSKTTLALVIPSVLFGWFMSYKVRQDLVRNIVSLMLVVSILFMVILSREIIEVFESILADPFAFTGRSTIWDIMYQCIQDNFWLGLGYGSVWRVGDDMLLVQYAHGWVDWVFTLTQGHNSYLDLILSLGFFGFVIVIWSILLSPFFKMMYERKSSSDFSFLFYCMLFFIVFHGLLENNLLNADKGRWVVYLVVYCIVYMNTWSGRYNDKPDV